ncbi:MAG: DUF4300 family protein [Clostridium sp.]|uniref:DUF4300 family protein n=1 Tax=Clostridium sp. TaxID=1506 RepID=UPI0025BE370C|nr:DUF4300 family protein [Clostridium sp.]MBS4957858.1 DUF4300 family protein [Clostridium sp.]
MKKKFSAIALALVISSVMISCGENKSNLKEDNNISTENQVEKFPVTLSNIASKEMQDEIKTLLINNNINEENADRYIKYINDFNERVKDKTLLKEEFVTVDSMSGLYNSIILEDRIAEDGSIFGEINCRLASFELFKEFVSTKGEIQVDNYLIFDIEAIENNPIISFTDEDKKKYINLFNPIDIGNVKDTNEIVKLIKEELNKREVKIDNQGNVSLINIYMNDEIENKMFVGHSVVMIENANEYLIIEKFSPMDPFQISKFSSREDVKKYLLSRNDIYGSDINPIVLINNEEF